MDESCRKRVLFESDWYSPRRLHDSPTQYDFPGDRFIPNRSLMNLDQAHFLLATRTGQTPPSPDVGQEEYQQKSMESLNLDSEGRPFKMLVFRGSPQSSRKSIRYIDEIRRDDIEALNNNKRQCQNRRLPKGEVRILDAPGIKNDYYANRMDWGKNNILAVALGSGLYLWNGENNTVQLLFHAYESNDHPTSIAWSQDARSLAVGFMHSKLQLWDVETLKCIRSLEDHKARIATMAWNGHILTSGSQDKTILNHDVRVRDKPTSCLQAHSDEVCGLKWSNGGNVLASGGNDNAIYIWEASKMSSSNFLHRFRDHTAAVKALAWCPYQSNVLASGGGMADGCIKIWNTQSGTCIYSMNTYSQVCGLQWNRHHKEILSGHGYGRSELMNNLCLWKYPSMTKVWATSRHLSRVLDLSQSPDGLTVVSAAADETLRFWNIFGPPCAEKHSLSELDCLLSLKISPIR